MYQAIVIDDEKISREVISGYLKKFCKDFSVVACFPSGEKALEYMEKNAVDLVVTDVKMPGLSGLDLIKKIKERNYACYIIVISGFSKFEYARAAIEYQVENYILKPVNIKELVKTVIRVKEKIDNDRNRNFGLFARENDKKEGFLLDLVQGVFEDEDEIRANFYARSFDFEFEKSSGYLFIVKVRDFEKYIMKNWKYGKDSVYNAFLNVFRTIFELKNIYVIKNTETQLFFLGFCETDAVNIPKTELEETFERLLNVNVSIVKKERFLGICDIPPLLKDYLNVDNSVSVLFSHIMNGDEKEATALFESMCKNKDGLYDYVIENLYHRLNELNIHISKMDFFSDYGNAVRYFIKNVGKFAKKDDYIISNAISYIQEHYQEDITREDVAGAVYLESTYFSKYFKNKTGNTFHSYLFNFRMNKAIEFLRSGVSVTEVFSMVGYSDLTYFNKKFKQFTGCTPGEYKKQFIEGKRK